VLVGLLVGLPDGLPDGLLDDLPDGWPVASLAASPNGCGWQILQSPVTICGVLLVIGSAFFLAGLPGGCVFAFSSFQVFEFLGFRGTEFSNFNNVTNWTL
jgi:hypothetical protein